MMKSKILLGLSVTMVSLLSTAHAVCGSNQTMEQAQDKSVNFVQSMQVARARGDIAHMNQSYQDYYLGFYQNCSDADKIKVCDYQCHTQLGEFHQFMASEISYYYSKSVVDSNLPVLRPEELQQWVDDGITIVEFARDALISQSQQEDNGDYFVRSARFNLLLAKLYMTAGDNWYQSLSETKIERLSYLVANNTGQSQNDDDSSQNQAKSLYKKANWIIQSAYLELPREAAYAGLEAEFSLFRNELTERMNSIDKGYLFIDIDPESFSTIPTRALRTELDQLSAEIGAMESRITHMISEWAQMSNNQDIDQINEQRRGNQITITQSSFKLAKLEGLAQEYANQISGEIEKVRDESTSFQFKMDRFNYEFGLKIKLEEMRNRQQSIQARREIDVLSFEQESADRRLNDLRWLMNWQIAKNNIEMQLSQFLSQIEEYESRRFRKENSLLQIEAQIASNDARIAIAQTNQNDALLTKQQLINERDLINAESVAAIEAQLCGVENRLSYLRDNSVPEDYQYINYCENYDFSVSLYDYQEKMCGDGGLRKTLAAQRVDSVKEALCAVGIDTLPQHIIDDNDLVCPPGSQIALAKEIFEKEMTLAEMEIASTENQRARVKDLIKQVKADFVKATLSKAALEVMAVKLGLSAKVAAGLPKISTCACGLAAGIITRDESDEPIKLAADFAYRALGIAVSWHDFINRHNKEYKSLNNSLDQIEEALDKLNYAKMVKNLHANKALMEMTNSALNYSNQYLEQIIQEDIVALDCEQQGSSLDDQVASSQSQYRQLIARIRAIDFQNTNINLSIEKQDNLWNVGQKNIAVLNNSNLELAIEKDSVNNEIASIDTLISHVQDRRQLVLDLSETLTELEGDADATSNAIEELRALRQDKILALSDQEFDQVERVIQLSQTHTDGLIEFSEQLESLAHLDNSLRSDVTQFRQDIDALVKEEREKILNQVEMNLIEHGQNNKQRVFMANQQDLAMLTEGIPHFIDAKRRYLERANRLLVLLRNRTQALVSLTGGNPLSLGNSESVTFVKTRSDLEKLKTLVEDQFWDNQQQIVTQTTRIKIDHECGLARQLADTKQANFEISPYAAGSANALGCYSLWSSDFDRDDFGFMQNLLLLDINLIVEFSNSENCSGRRFAVTHSGNGVVFKETSANDPSFVPSIVIAKPRTLLPTFVDFDLYKSSIPEEVKRFWEKNHFLSSFLEVAPPNETGTAGGVVPLLGLPLIGQYQLTLPNAPEICSYQDASFYLEVAYASDPRLAN